MSTKQTSNIEITKLLNSLKLKIQMKIEILFYFLVFGVRLIFVRMNFGEDLMR